MLCSKIKCDASVALLILIFAPALDFCDTVIVPAETNPMNGSGARERGGLPEANSITRKWGSALNAGFQVVPNVLLRAQSRLNLDAVDVVILLNLNLHWWTEDRLPYPPPTLIAARMGVSRRTVERRILRMQKEGWLERLPAEGNKEKRKIRKYDLSGLVERLKEAAVIGVSQRNYRSIVGPRGNTRRNPPVDGPRTQRLLGSGSN